jgi:hypothetical protein
MFDKFIYKLCDKIATFCETTKSRIKTTSEKDWLKGYHKWKKRINNNDTDNTGNTNTTNTKI